MDIFKTGETEEVSPCENWARTHAKDIAEHEVEDEKTEWRCEAKRFPHLGWGATREEALDMLAHRLFMREQVAHWKTDWRTK